MSPVPRRSNAATAALLVALSACVLAAALPGTRRASAATPHPRAPARPCAPQHPQAFLIRANYLPRSGMSAAEARRRAAVHGRSLRYRTEQYGHVEGHGPQDANPRPVTRFLEHVTFMGLPIQLHRRIVPALRCVEADLRRSCAHTPYQPKGIGGYRDYNSYRHGEVTNHLFGIAIDIDPDQNPCCGCVDPWPNNPRCAGTVRSVYERMAMPECWVRVFERHGFYWLGHDVLQDTMHFEFLGKPDRLGR
jgi:hypothetical protein